MSSSGLESGLHGGEEDRLVWTTIIVCRRNNVTLISRLVWVWRDVFYLYAILAAYALLL